MACGVGRLNIVSWLIQEGWVDVNCQLADNDFFSMEIGESSKEMLALLATANVENTCEILRSIDLTCIAAGHNRTALHLAALQNRLSVVSFLLSHGADQAIYDDNMQTPKHLATLKHHNRITAELASFEQSIEENDCTSLLHNQQELEDEALCAAPYHDAHALISSKNYPLTSETDTQAFLSDTDKVGFMAKNTPPLNTLLDQIQCKTKTLQEGEKNLRVRSSHELEAQGSSDSCSPNCCRIVCVLVTGVLVVFLLYFFLMLSLE